MASHNLFALLDAQADARPDATALIFAKGQATTSWTFAELRDQAHRYAHGFADAGIGRGDRTLLLMKPCLDFYAVVFGLLAVGAIPVLMDPGMGVGPLLTCVREAKPKALIAISPVHAVRTFVRGPFASVEVLITAGSRWFWGGTTLARCLEAAEGAGPFQIADFEASDEAAIVFTSGSTGVPKGVSFRHGMFRSVTEVLREAIGLCEGRVTLETFAAFVLIDVALGMTAVVPDMNLSKPATADPRKLVEALVTHDCDVAFASPVVLRKITAQCASDGVTLSALRTVLSGVAPVPGELHGALRSVAPGATLAVNYGATECLCATHIDSDEVLGETWALTQQGAGTCVGRPFPGMQVRIAHVRDDTIEALTDDLLLPAEAIGEILVRGPIASPEYKDRPDANLASKIIDGDGFWHRTGDLGYLDPSGRLWFCGRKAHRVETAEGMVPAVPVEGVFNRHDAVRRSALVGVGPAGSQRAVLCVEPLEPSAWTDQLTQDMLGLASGTRWEGTVAEILVHPSGFPVDARHNAKIRRDELARWATSRVASA